MKKDEICKNCAFFQADRSKNGSIGWCWKNPPQILVRKAPSHDGQPRESIKTARPIVAKQDFCSHWEDAKEDGRREEI